MCTSDCRLPVRLDPFADNLPHSFRIRDHLTCCSTRASLLCSSLIALPTSMISQVHQAPLHLAAPQVKTQLGCRWDCCALEGGRARRALPRHCRPWRPRMRLSSLAWPLRGPSGRWCRWSRTVSHRGSWHCAGWFSILLVWQVLAVASSCVKQLRQVAAAARQACQLGLGRLVHHGQLQACREVSLAGRRVCTAFVWFAEGRAWLHAWCSALSREHVPGHAACCGPSADHMKVISDKQVPSQCDQDVLQHGKSSRYHLPQHCR